MEGVKDVLEELVDRIAKYEEMRNENRTTMKWNEHLWATTGRTVGLDLLEDLERHKNTLTAMLTLNNVKVLRDGCLVIQDSSLIIVEKDWSRAFRAKKLGKEMLHVLINDREKSKKQQGKSRVEPLMELLTAALDHNGFDTTPTGPTSRSTPKEKLSSIDPGVADHKDELHIIQSQVQRLLNQGSGVNDQRLEGWLE